MAKKPMICPFSKKLCRECSFYVGRHYYLCFSENYRGYLGNQPEEKLGYTYPSNYNKVRNKTY